MLPEDFTPGLSPFSTPASPRSGIHHLVETQVKQTPDAVALISGSSHVTYQQLNQRANQLAHRLLTAGVGPDVLVGIYSERSPEMIVGLLAILKAGGAYVPIDPLYPADRVAFILQDTQAPVILTQSHLLPQLAGHAATATILCLDTDGPGLTPAPITNPGVPSQPDHLMYTIYTSGSTGQPKGVMITHANIQNQLRWRQRTFPLTAADRVLQNISFSFDPSVWQIFWPLVVGAQVVLPRPGGQQDIPYLISLIAHHQITVMALVPALLRVFLEAKDLERCRSLRHIFCGGEALTRDLQVRFNERFSADTQLHNVYGPTEAAIDATWWSSDRHLIPDDPVAPIGRPITNTELYILTDDRQPVPAGEPGELYIGGAGLARGYLNRPALTAEKFVPHPWSTDPAARLYKTGDLVRCRPDGNLEFLGRIDYQVKIRGFRIELEEIEATLNQHPQVQQSIVVAREDVPGDKRLWAYWIPTHPQSAASAETLRAWLRTQLPEYMLPATLTMLTAFPLSPNGKVDRQALPAPSLERSRQAPAVVPPQTDIERSLVTLWEKLLNVQPIGVTDNFFELGGNSLLAAYLFTEIAEVWEQELPISLLFEAPTIAQLAHQLQSSEPPQTARSLVTIQAGTERPPLFCLHTRTGQVFDYYPIARYLGADQPVYGLQAPQIDGKPTFHNRIEDMAADYVQALRSVQPQGPYFLCGYSFGGLLAYEVAQQLRAMGQTIAFLAFVDTYNTTERWFTPLSRPAKLWQHVKNISELGRDGIWDYVQGKADRKFVPRDDIQASFLLDNDYCEQLARDYCPQPYPGAVALIKAGRQPKRDFMRSTAIDSTLGWRDLIQGGMDIHELPYDHFNLMKEPALKDLSRQLQLRLQAAQAKQVSL